MAQEGITDLYYKPDSCWLSERALGSWLIMKEGHAVASSLGIDWSLRVDSYVKLSLWHGVVIATGKYKPSGKQGLKQDLNCPQLPVDFLNVWRGMIGIKDQSGPSWYNPCKNAYLLHLCWTVGQKREEWELYQVLLTPLAPLKVISEKQLLNLTTTLESWFGKKKIFSILRLICLLFSYCSQSSLLFFFFFALFCCWLGGFCLFWICGFGVLSSKLYHEASNCWRIPGSLFLIYLLHGLRLAWPTSADCIWVMNRESTTFPAGSVCWGACIFLK